MTFSIITKHFIKNVVIMKIFMKNVVITKILMRNTVIKKIFMRNVVHNYYENLFEECCYDENFCIYP